MFHTPVLVWASEHLQDGEEKHNGSGESKISFYGPVECSEVREGKMTKGKRAALLL